MKNGILDSFRSFKSNLEMIVRVINILQVLVLRKKIVIHEIQYFVKKKGRERERFITICFIHVCTYSTSRDTNPFLKQRIPFMRSL